MAKPPLFPPEKPREGTPRKSFFDPAETHPAPVESPRAIPAPMFTPGAGSPPAVVQRSPNAIPSSIFPEDEIDALVRRTVDEVAIDEGEGEIRGEANRITRATIALGLDGGKLITFGETAQSRVSEIASDYLEMVRSEPPTWTYLRDILRCVEVIGIEDILRSRASPFWSKLFPTSRKMIDHTVLLVDDHIRNLRGSMPALQEKLTKTLALISEERSARLSVHAHFLALLAVQRYWQGRATSPQDDYAMWVLEDRIQALRTSRAVNASMRFQIAALRDHYSSAMTKCGGVIHDLVGVWKQQIGAAMAIADLKQIGDITVATNAVMDVRRKLIDAVRGVMEMKDQTT